MMTVHVVDSFGPTIGGIERQVDTLSTVQSLDMPTAVLTSQRGPTGDAAPRRVLQCGRFDRDGISRAFERLQPYVVHAHVSVVSPFALLAATTAVRAGIPVVMTVHSMWDRFRPPSRWLGSLLEPRHATWTAVSSVAARHARNALAGSEVTVLPNLVDDRRWTFIERAPIRETGPLRMLAVGRLARIKEVGRLVDDVGAAWWSSTRRAEFVLDIVGDGPQHGNIRRTIRRSGLGEVIRLHGALPADEVRRRMADADVFVAPARREAFGIAALEARLAGLPVIGWSDTGLADFLQDGHDALLLDNRAQFRRCLGELFDRGDAADGVRHAAATSLPRYNAESTVQAVRSTYRRAQEFPAIYPACPRAPLHV